MRESVAAGLATGESVPAVVEIFSNSAGKWFVALVVSTNEAGTLTVRFVDGEEVRREKEAHYEEPCLAQFATHTEGLLPPGIVAVPSSTRPGQHSYLDPVEQQKYATPELAWQAFLERNCLLDDEADGTSPPASAPVPLALLGSASDSPGSACQGGQWLIPPEDAMASYGGYGREIDAPAIMKAAPHVVDANVGYKDDMNLDLCKNYDWEAHDTCNGGGSQGIVPMAPRLDSIGASRALSIEASEQLSTLQVEQVEPEPAPSIPSSWLRAGGSYATAPPVGLVLESPCTQDAAAIRAAVAQAMGALDEGVAQENPPPRSAPSFHETSEPSRFQDPVARKLAAAFSSSCAWSSDVLMAEPCSSAPFHPGRATAMNEDFGDGAFAHKALPVEFGSEMWQASSAPRDCGFDDRAGIAPSVVSTAFAASSPSSPQALAPQRDLGLGTIASHGSLAPSPNMEEDLQTSFIYRPKDADAEPLRVVIVGGPPGQPEERSDFVDMPAVVAVKPGPLPKPAAMPEGPMVVAAAKPALGQNRVEALLAKPAGSQVGFSGDGAPPRLVREPALGHLHPESPMLVRDPDIRPDVRAAVLTPAAQAAQQGRGSGVAVPPRAQVEVEIESIGPKPGSTCYPVARALACAPGEASVRAQALQPMPATAPGIADFGASPGSAHWVAEGLGAAAWPGPEGAGSGWTAEPRSVASVPCCRESMAPPPACPAMRAPMNYAVCGAEFGRPPLRSGERRSSSPQAPPRASPGQRELAMAAPSLPDMSCGGSAESFRPSLAAPDRSSGKVELPSFGGAPSGRGGGGHSSQDAYLEAIGVREPPPAARTLPPERPRPAPIPAERRSGGEGFAPRAPAPNHPVVHAAHASRLLDQTQDTVPWELAARHAPAATWDPGPGPGCRGAAAAAAPASAAPPPGPAWTPASSLWAGPPPKPQAPAREAPSHSGPERLLAGPPPLRGGERLSASS
mmetsp:Transcript_29009/g.63422  ORF Transcript_29009/g.63422 Transcript_29009/m.63422 type:complete len:965 (+) Transcript_29009:96-2990(+)